MLAYALLAVRCWLALALVGAGLAKLRRTDRAELADALRRYGVLPRTLVAPVARTLPWVELLLGVALGLGVLPVVSSGCTAALLGVFAFAVGWHAARRRRFACGCGGGGTVSWALMSRDLLLAAGAVAVALGPAALALWPGSAGAQAAVPIRDLIPVPMLAVLLVVVRRLLAAGLEARSAMATGLR